MVELGTPEQQSLDNVKQSILIIEGLFFAVNNSNIPMRFAEQAIKGMAFLQQMHQQLIGQLPAGELEKMRAQYKSNVPPPPVPVA